jgi:predicted enzyme related to lactoylglutathione lyase
MRHAGDRSRRPLNHMSLDATRARASVIELLANIDVDDLEKAIEFYQNALGLHLARRLFDDTVAEMVGASSRIYLLSKLRGTSAGPLVPQSRDYRRHWTPVHLDFVVADVDAAVRQAQAAGAIVEGETQTHTWGRIATVSDPFGHGFCLLQFTGRGYDVVA